MGTGRGGSGSRGRRGIRPARRGSRRRPRSAISSPCRRAASLMVSGDTGPLHVAAAGGHAGGCDFRSDRSGPERTVGAGRRDRVAVRIVRVPLRAALSSAVRLVSRRSAGLRGDRRDSAAARQRPSGGAGGMTSSLLRGIARRRVTIGFVSSALALWLARPCARSLADRRGRGDRRRSDARVGGGASREGARGHDVGSVRVHAASAVSRVDAHRDRPGDRVGERDRRGARDRVPGDHADGGGADGGSAPHREVRRRLSRRIAKGARRTGGGGSAWRAPSATASIARCSGWCWSCWCSRGRRAVETCAGRPVLPGGRVHDYNRVLAGRLAGPLGHVGAVSSVGRAPALHAGCQGFESLTAHHLRSR